MKYLIITILSVVVIFLFVRLLNRRKYKSRLKSLPRVYNNILETLQTQASDLILFEEYHHIVAITDQVLRIVPRNHDALVLRALALEALNFNLEALEDYELAHSLKELDANTYGLFGLTYRKIGEIEKGQQYLKLSIEKGLKDYEGNYNYVNIASPLAVELIKAKSKTPENLQRRNLPDFVKYLTESNKTELVLALKKQIYNLKAVIEIYPENKEYPLMLIRTRDALKEFELNGH